eukprot:1463663-Prymnesium_polylepis.1
MRSSITAPVHAALTATKGGGGCLWPSTVDAPLFHCIHSLPSGSLLSHVMRALSRVRYEMRQTTETCVRVCL